MYCGPNAVARLTGWTRDQVWLHIRWLREREGRRITRHPVGGTSASECISALERAGYTATPVLQNVRRDYIEFCKHEGRTGRWLLRQPRHLFAHIAREDGVPIRTPGWKFHCITDAWRVTRATPSARATGPAGLDGDGVRECDG